MNWLSEIEKLVDRKPEWHTRLMNAINCGFAEYSHLIDDLREELGEDVKCLELNRAMHHYQQRAEDELHDEYRIDPSNP